jgi:hypothetical protein
MSTVKIKGLKAIINRWSLSEKKAVRRTARGLKAGATLLRNESVKLVPVQDGELKKSAYVRSIGKRSGKGAAYAVGYTAPYAAVVHEDLSAVHGKMFNAKHARAISKARTSKSASQRKRWHKRRPDEQAKFLEAPARTKRREIFQIIAINSKLK